MVLTPMSLELNIATYALASFRRDNIKHLNALIIVPCVYGTTLTPALINIATCCHLAGVKKTLYVLTSTAHALLERALSCPYIHKHLAQAFYGVR